jgi:hypothetical protein
MLDIELGVTGFNRFSYFRFKNIMLDIEHYENN